VPPPLLLLSSPPQATTTTASAANPVMQLITLRERATQRNPMMTSSVQD
jgi:hypothetical protein